MGLSDLPDMYTHSGVRIKQIKRVCDIANMYHTG